MNDTTILITGASGFVGAHLALDLAKSGNRVIAVGGSHICSPAVADKVFAVRNTELSSIDNVVALIAETKPDVIVHSAALARAELCEKNPGLAERINVRATKNLLYVAAQTLFLQISTDLVFDGAIAPAGGFAEDAPPQPATVYGKTKAAAEQAVLLHANSLVLRTCLVYGNKIGSSAGFLGWLTSGLESGTPVSMFVDEWRTPIFTKDISRAIRKIIVRRQRTSLSQDKANHSRILHLAGAERITRYDFARKYAEVFAYNKDLVLAARQADLPGATMRSPDVSLSAEILQQEYSFRPVDVATGLGEMLADA